VTLKTGFVISNLQSGHDRIIRVGNSVAIFACYKIIDNRIFEGSGSYRMTVFTWQRPAVAVLMVTGPATVRHGGMALMVKPH
jgi:hypothetical protein